MNTKEAAKVLDDELFNILCDLQKAKCVSDDLINHYLGLDIHTSGGESLAAHGFEKAGIRAEIVADCIRSAIGKLERLRGDA